MKYLKTGNSGELNTNKLEIVIAELYLYSLPFRLFTQLSFLKNLFGVCANYMSFVFHILGMVFWVINENGKIHFHGKVAYILKNMGFTLIYLNLSSLVMAVVIQSQYGNHGSENALSGISGMVVYFIQYFFIFVYNARVFELLDRKIINRILHIDCLLLLFIAYFQILVMNGIGTNIYDRMNIFGNQLSSSKLSKLSLTDDEGSNAGRIIGAFVLPYLFSQIICTGQKKFIFEVFAWVLPLFFTYSSVAYILLVVDTFIFVVFLLKSRKHLTTTLTTVLLLLFFLSIGIYILKQTGIIDSSVFDKIEYILLKKATDTENGSTVSRTVTLLVNWGAFKEYPVFGVGNGLQGYFFEKYIPSWAYKVKGSDIGKFITRSKNGISNGGTFFPSLLSGYGIIGCLIIAFFVYKLVYINYQERIKNENFYIMFLIAAIAFFVMGFTGDAYGKYYAWFMLSLPLYNRRKDETTIEN